MAEGGFSAVSAHIDGNRFNPLPQRADRGDYQRITGTES
jgi:hypothetical protein